MYSKEVLSIYDENTTIIHYSYKPSDEVMDGITISQRQMTTNDSFSNLTENLLY